MFFFLYPHIPDFHIVVSQPKYCPIKSYNNGKLIYSAFRLYKYGWFCASGSHTRTIVSCKIISGVGLIFASTVGSGVGRKRFKRPEGEAHHSSSSTAGHPRRRGVGLSHQGHHRWWRYVWRSLMSLCCLHTHRRVDR